MATCEHCGTATTLNDASPSPFMAGPDGFIHNAKACRKVLLAQIDRAEALLRFGLDCNFFECPNNPPCDDPEDGFAVDHYCDACKLVHDATVLFGWTEDE